MSGFAFRVSKDSQLQVRLVNQGCGIERVVTVPTPPLRPSEFAQLLVDDGEHLVEGVPIAVSPGLEQHGHPVR